MIIGQETNLKLTVAEIEDLTEKCAQTLLGTVDVHLNGRIVNKSRFDDTDRAFIRDSLLTVYCRELAQRYTELRDVFGIVYTPEIYDVAAIKAAMIAQFPTPEEPTP